MADRIDNTVYDLNRLYQKAFGHVGLPYPAGGLNTLGNPAATAVKTVEGAFRFRSELGAEYRFPVKIDRGDDPAAPQWWQLPNEPLVSVYGSKQVVETRLNRGERKQNVTEEVNLNPYRVRIRGVMYGGEADEYPEDDVRALRQVFEKDGPRAIACPLLDLFGIDRVVLKAVNVPGVPGTPEAQAYVIEAFSDEPFELERADNRDNR